jgi:conjugative relaxase-like TrwC/TraI family protein
MIVTMSKPLSMGQVESYYKSYDQGDYYTNTHTTPGTWFGRGSELLGLRGEVQKDHFDRLARGQHPLTGEQMVQWKVRHELDKQTGERELKIEHRAGWDVTFAASKSVSIQATVDERIREALLNKAVAETMKEVEQQVQVRVARGTERETTGNMVAAVFRHDVARDPGSGLVDPHSHFHVVVFNISRSSDGAWRAIDPKELYASQKWATALASNKTAETLHGLGYQIVRGEKGMPEIGDITKEQREHFSQRHKQIDSVRAEKGSTDNPELVERIQRETREKKYDVEPASLEQQWAERSQSIGLNRETIRDHAIARGPLKDLEPETRARVANEAVSYSLAHVTERHAVVDAREIETHALHRGGDWLTAADVRNEIKSRIDREDMIAARTEKHTSSQYYTTREMLQKEQHNILVMKAGQGKVEAIGNSVEVKTWAIERGLLPDQVAVAKGVLTSTDRYISIEGKAGATKTFTMGRLRECMQEKGYEVKGFGPTTGAVKALKEAGITATQTTQFLNQTPIKSIKEQATQVWIADESSQWSTQMTHEFIARAEKAGARVIFVGDQRQHHAVEAGSPVQQMQQAGMATYQLDVIRRQQDPELRAAVELASRGETRAAAEQLDKLGRVQEIENQHERYSTIAKDYADAAVRGERVLTTSATNAERRDINQYIRRELRARGLVNNGGYVGRVLVPKDLTAAEKGWASKYEPGDVIRFSRGSKEMGIQPGSIAKVERVYPENKLSISTPSGKQIEFDPKQLKGTQVYQEDVREFAQGDRVQFMAPIKAYRVTNGEFGKITSIDSFSGDAYVQLDSGRFVNLNLAKVGNASVDHGYTATSFRSQGQTVDRVLLNVNIERGNAEQFYVGISRARFDIKVYTNDRHELPVAVAREKERTTALAAVKNQAQQEKTQDHGRDLTSRSQEQREQEQAQKSQNLSRE